MKRLLLKALDDMVGYDTFSPASGKDGKKRMRFQDSKDGEKEKRSRGYSIL